MTSWVRYNRPIVPQASREELDVVFQTGTSGFCTQFNRYFYHVFYARRIGKALQFRDTPSCMGDTYPLIRSLFQDASGARIVETLPAGSPRQDIKMFDVLSRTPRDTLRVAAREVLRWRPEVESQIQGVLKAMGIPDRFDVGLQIRTSATKPISVDRYLRALDAFVATAPAGRKVRVFVASDNATALKELQARTSGAPYEIYSIAGDHGVNGHVQATFATKPFDDKFNDMMIFLTELYLLQRCPMLVCTLSSNVGKFLLLTAESVRNFRSLDLPELVPL
jgi:hypothetical protein